MEVSQGMLSLKMDWLIIVDYENQVTFDPNLIPDGAQVIMIVGNNQNCLPVELVQKTQPLGSRIEWIKVKITAPNAADFVLAYELGLKLTQAPNYNQIAILSRDKGFDALVNHITRRKRYCQRVENLSDLTTPTQVIKPVKTLEECLQASSSNRPSTVTSLTKFIANRLKKDASDPAVDEAIRKLKDTHVIQVQEASGKISYPKLVEKATVATKQPQPQKL